jgi:hypothetical protein
VPLPVTPEHEPLLHQTTLAPLNEPDRTPTVRDQAAPAVARGNDLMVIDLDCLPAHVQALVVGYFDPDNTEDRMTYLYLLGGDVSLKVQSLLPEDELENVQMAYTAKQEQVVHQNVLADRTAERDAASNEATRIHSVPTWSFTTTACTASRVLGWTLSTITGATMLGLAEVSRSSDVTFAKTMRRPGPPGLMEYDTAKAGLGLLVSGLAGLAGEVVLATRCLCVRNWAADRKVTQAQARLDAVAGSVSRHAQVIDSALDGAIRHTRIVDGPPNSELDLEPEHDVPHTGAGAMTKAGADATSSVSTPPHETVEIEDHNKLGIRTLVLGGPQVFSEIPEPVQVSLPDLKVKVWVSASLLDHPVRFTDPKTQKVVQFVADKDGYVETKSSGNETNLETKASTSTSVSVLDGPDIVVHITQESAQDDPHQIVIHTPVDDLDNKHGDTQ